MKKDSLWFAIALVVFGVALFFFLNSRKPTATRPPASASFGEGLAVLVVIGADDCLDCVEKTLCSWSAWQEHLATNMPRVKTQLVFASQEGPDFPRDYLSPLCELPLGTHFLSTSDPILQPLALTVTPTVLVFFRNQRIYQHPIFVDTQIADIRTEVDTILSNIQMSAGL